MDSPQTQLRAMRVVWLARRTTGPKLVQALSQLVNDWQPDEIVDVVNFAMRQLPRDLRRSLYSAATAFVQGVSTREFAGEFRLSVIDETADAVSAKALAKELAKTGEISTPLRLLEAHIEDRSGALYKRLVEQNRLALEGVSPSSCSREHLRAENRRALYFVSQSCPHHSIGYAIRTQYLMKALQAANWDMQVAARFGYPTDRNDYGSSELPPLDAVVDEVSYHFSPDPVGVRGKEAQAQHEVVVDALLKQCDALRPSLIHSASNHVVGMAGAIAAKTFGIPSIYEVRGFWHMSRAAKEPGYQDSEHYRMIESLEVQAALESDHVFVLTERMKQTLVDASVAPSSITLLPNAVDSDRFVPQTRDAKLEKELGLKERLVIGFLGSMAAYEGLEDLLEAMYLLKAEVGDSVCVLLVGDGAAKEALVARAKALGLDEAVRFTGRVPHDDVSGYYSLMDVLCYPRRSLKVCEFVSPLKPFEAMAQEKAVVVSSVAALAEIVEHDVTGLVHTKGDVASLASCLRRLIADPGLRKSLGENAGAWVRKERTWQRNAETVSSVYERLLAEVGSTRL